jgi:hypothetical protein
MSGTGEKLRDSRKEDPYSQRNDHELQRLPQRTRYNKPVGEVKETDQNEQNVKFPASRFPE